MLSKNYITHLKNVINDYSTKKDLIIQKWIEINKLTKSIIYSLIRWDINSAKKYIKQLNKMAQEYIKLLEENKLLGKYWDISLQEYAEALIFYKYLTTWKIPTHKQLPIQIDEINYIFWLIDFCWELFRKSMEEMINWNIEFAINSKQTIHSIYLAMLHLEFKNFDLRKKLDYLTSILSRLTEKILDKKQN